jgi:hypothetical protein
MKSTNLWMRANFWTQRDHHRQSFLNKTISTSNIFPITPLEKGNIGLGSRALY